MLADNVWSSQLDANSTYWQVSVKESDRNKTAFITKHGLFEFQKMSFVLFNAPATYARVMNLILRGLNWNIVLAFLEDIMVLRKSFSEHLDNLRMVLLRFMEYNLKLKPTKCQLFKNRVEFFDRMVSEDGSEICKKIASR